MRRSLVSLLIIASALVAAGLFSRLIPVSDTGGPQPTPTLPPPVSKFKSASLPVAGNEPPPAVSAHHIFILDRDSKLVLYSQAADDRIYPASTTKMMTALVASDQYSLDDQITVPKAFPEGSHLGLIAGEKVTVENLLYALLVQSANDAAEVLAAGYPGGRAAFVSAMNAKAAQLHLQNTHFLNPTGLDETGHYSSASDLARLADRLVDNPNLRRIVSTENAVVASVDYTQLHPVSNVNQLLGKVPGVMGVKTGFTDLAGESLVTLVDRDSHEVIFSVMGSQDRFGDATKLIDWVYSNFTWK